jgi:aspartyl-tRNA synthetase
MPTVGLKKRLTTRVLDLRVPTNKAIFMMQSGVCQLFREYLIQNNFFEIHSPKILGGSSEGGAEVFKTDYFGKPASLAQSPQLFKQMAIMGDFERVFEIGPVFRAEDSNTPRHLCEFVGLDMEMEIKESYFEVMHVIGNLFNHMFRGLETQYAEHISVVNQQFPFEKFEYLDEPLMLTFKEGIQLLKDHGMDADPNEDLITIHEKALGKIVKDKFKTDFYILHRYPIKARPFYTMVCEDDPEYTCSYDVFMRGEEIISGAQRVHDVAMLKERAIYKGMNPDDISYYCESFQYGAYPHGGFGTGLERVIKLFLNLHNVRQTSLFPRTPDILVP